MGQPRWRRSLLSIDSCEVEPGMVPPDMWNADNQAHTFAFAELTLTPINLTHENHTRHPARIPRI
jgi:hypothetical protein